MVPPSARARQSRVTLSAMARRRRSSRLWRLPTEQRRDLYIAGRLFGLVDAVETIARAGGADLTPELLERLEEMVAAGLGDAFAAGAEPVADLASAVESARALVRRMEAVLRQHGLPVPTERMPSDVPPATPDEDEG
jgi:hypothetical protein